MSKHLDRMLLILLGLVLVWHVVREPHRYNSRLDNELKKVFVQTALGKKSYEDVNEAVFKRLGYYISKATVPVPMLRFEEEPTCEKVFTDWLKIAEQAVPDKPPDSLPEQEKHLYTLFGHSLFTLKYYNDRSQSSSAKWDMIEQYVENPELMNLTYGIDSKTVESAMVKYSLPNQRGVVIGSLTPWVEVFAIRAGAREVLTVEYRNTTITNTEKSQLSYIHPFDFARNYERFESTFDFAASYSSIEHSGLQRYGDPADPIGDIREVLKIRCSLKTGGLFFLGIPRSQDHITFNAHRIYGRLRLALLFAGFELLDVYRAGSTTPVVLSLEDFDGKTSGNGFEQDLFVLQKI